MRQGARHLLPRRVHGHEGASESQHHRRPLCDRTPWHVAETHGDPSVVDEFRRWPLQFLCGDDLLVHPVTVPGVTTWRTYLPEGGWVDAWTGEPFGGGQVVEHEVARDVVPVYCRADRRERTAHGFHRDW